MYVRMLYVRVHYEMIIINKAGAHGEVIKHIENTS